LVRQIRDPLQTNNLFVELPAIPSGLTAEDDEKRSAAASGSRPRGRIIREPAGSRRRLRMLPTNPADKIQENEPKQASRQPPAHEIPPNSINRL
jgi:hypothetical protein